MFDALKSLGSGRPQKQADELETLIATAKEERDALSALLAQVTMRGAGLTQLGESLSLIDRKAETTHVKLDGLVLRLEALEQRALAFGDVEQRVQSLIHGVTQAQQAAEKVIAPGGELDAHRRQLQQLSAHTLETQASIEALKQERTALEEFRLQLHRSEGEMRTAVEGAASLKSELTQLQGTASHLAQDYARLRDTTRTAQEDSLAAVERVKQVEKRLGPLAQLHEQSKTVDEKLTALNALAEHVNQKTKALEAQKHTVDRAVLEANRLNEMVWGMDVQIGKLNEGLKQTDRAEETVARIEQLVAGATAQVDAAARARDHFARESARLEHDGRTLLDAMRGFIDKLGLDKKEFEGFTQRLRLLGTSLNDAEARLELLAAKERHLSQLGQSIAALGKDVHALSAQADDLATKQATIEALQDRLGDVDELGRRTAAQHDALLESRADVDALRKEIESFRAAHVEVAQLRDRLAADRTALEAFGERVTTFKALTPALQATMDAIQAKLGQVEQGTAAAARLDEFLRELDAHATRVHGRLQFVDALDTRLHALHELSSQVDGRLAAQLARRAELEALEAQCDGVVARASDAQQRLEALAAARDKLRPLAAGVDALQARLDHAARVIASIQLDESIIAAQRARLVELVEQSQALSTQTDERMQQTRAFTEELQRSTSAKEELLDELLRLQQRQREALAHVDAADEQMARTETMFKALDQRRSQLAFADRKAANVEARVTELLNRTADLDRRMEALAERDAVVASVKTELENIHRIGAKSRADLEFIVDHREEVTATRSHINELLTRMSEAEEKVAAIEARRKAMDDVQRRATQIANLLEDVRLNLETLGERKALIDHVAEKLARLDFLMQEAQNTVRTLQHERELAERMEQNIRQLRARGGPGDADTPAQRA